MGIQYVTIDTVSDEMLLGEGGGGVEVKTIGSLNTIVDK